MQNRRHFWSASKSATQKINASTKKIYAICVAFVQEKQMGKHTAKTKSGESFSKLLCLHSITKIGEI